MAGNLVGAPDSGFESDTNTVTLFFSDDTTESLPTMEKREVAHILLDRIVTKIMRAAAAPKRIKNEQ
jgi:phosphopantothenoylcysteine decarboxylase/phosphopantothenate--cysteine ligase